jgi:iron complex outermembrane receptor protein
MPFATLTSYSQGRFEKSLTHYNLEGSSLSYFALMLPIYDRTLSQEFLLASKGSGPLQWTAGVFLFDYSDQYENVQDSILGSPFKTFTYSGTDTRSYAAYADVTYEVVHNLFLTAGARYTHDEVDDAFFTNVSATGVATRTNVSPSKTDTGTPRAVVRYKLTEFSSVYASFSQGYKAPILNVGGGTLKGIRVEPEHINAYEIGYKYGHGPLSADIAAYHYDYRDLQVAAQIGTASLINNAATARISGADGQVQYDVGHGLQLNIGAAYTDAKYGRYPNSASYVQCLNPTTCGASYGVFAVVPINASGNEMQRAPQFTGNLGARYSHLLAQGNLVLSGNFYDTSRVYFDSSNAFHQDAYNVTNLRAEWTDPSTRYTLALYTDNVTDTHYLSEVPTSNFGIRGIWAYPRTYGVSVRVHLK